jgi:sulfite oxidase
MNGEEIPKDHGYPLRLVVPGYIGVRNCKWVCKLEISDEEATSCMQRRDYKWVTETDWSKIDITSYDSIMGNYQNSCICEPICGDTVLDDKVTLKGWAIGDGEKGTQVVKV